LHEYSGPTLKIVIRNNNISYNGEDGVQLIDYPDISARFFVIERNLVDSNGMVGLGLMDEGDTVEDFRAAAVPERIHLLSNTFVDNDHAVTGGNNLIAVNNLFVNSKSVALKKVGGDSYATHNLFWNNGVDTQDSNVDLNTMYSVDPRLDSERRLQFGSPAIDAGAVKFEWRGETVFELTSDAFFGNAPDLGAFESQFRPPDKKGLPMNFR
jgi:hypothetical protein